LLRASDRAFLLRQESPIQSSLEPFPIIIVVADTFFDRRVEVVSVDYTFCLISPTSLNHNLVLIESHFFPLFFTPLFFIFLPLIEGSSRKMFSNFNAFSPRISAFHSSLFFYSFSLVWSVLRFSPFPTLSDPHSALVRILPSSLTNSSRIFLYRVCWVFYIPRPRVRLRRCKREIQQYQ